MYDLKLALELISKDFDTIIRSLKLSTPREGCPYVVLDSLVGTRTIQRMYVMMVFNY